MEKMPEAFVLAMELGYKSGMRSIKDLPGCWTYKVDEQWTIHVNGHAVIMACASGADIPPYHMYVEYNGWPAGLLGKDGGEFAAGEGANEGTFIEALKAAIEKREHAGE
jgi:hypothetical protein